jgi:excisionase family DNA binding protein
VTYQNSPAPRLASIKDAASLLGLSVPTIYRQIEAGSLKTVKIGRRRLVRMSSIEALTGEAA